MSKLWFGSSMRPYPEDEPCYFEPANFPWALNIENHWSEIKTEVSKLVSEQDRKFISNPLLYEQLAPTGNWTSYQFYYWGLKFSSDLKKCPVLNNCLKQVPGIVSAGLNKLDPHSVIPEHNGDSNASYRFHLGIEVPSSLPGCGLKAGGESRSWEEGKWLIFNDAHKHSAWNNTDKRRIILLIDVIRPEFMRKKNFICAFILTRYASFYYSRSKFLRKMPVAFKTILFGFIFLFIYIFKPFYNLVKK